MRAVLYARVSSVQQRDKHTIASQLHVLPEFVARQGWELVKPAAHYVDDGRSASAGKLEKREAFQRLLRDAASGLFDVVAVVDLDRITRSEDMAERGLIMGAFQKAGVQIAPMSGQTVDLSTITGDLLASLQMAISAEENKKRRERFMRGAEEAIRKGRKPRGKTPFGFTYDVATGTWGIRESEAAIVREMYERVNAGESAASIGRELGRRGVPSPSGGRWETGIWRLLECGCYRGTLSVDRQKRLSISVPRIVDDATWYAAQEAMARSGLRGLRRTKHVYLCEGIAFCGLCGSQMWVYRESLRLGNGRAYYVCSRRRRPRPHETRCTLPMRRVSHVDALIWGEIEALLTRPDLADIVGAHRREAAAETARWREDLREFEARMERLEQADRAILERFRKGLISDTAMDSHLEACAKERAFLARQIATARSQGEQAPEEPSSADLVVALRARVLVTSPTERRDLVRALIPGTGEQHVTIHADEVAAVAFFPTGKSAKLRALSAL